MGLRALRFFLFKCPGKSRGGLPCVCVSARCPRPFCRGAPRVAVQRLPRPLFCPVGAGAWPFGRAACWAARLCCGGALWHILSRGWGLRSLVVLSALFLGCAPFSFFLLGPGLGWSLALLSFSPGPLLCVAVGWLRRRSVFQESAFLGYVPFGTWRVTVGAGPCGSSQRHGVPGGLRRAGPSGGLPWVVRLFLCRLRPVPALRAVHRLRFGLFAPAPVALGQQAAKSSTLLGRRPRPA